jgi:selenoprotein W-related protein
MSTDNKPRVSIRYCTGCRWLLRAAWLAQELLNTFEQELGEVVLIPDSTGGVFDVHIDEQLIWSRAEQARFPEPKEIKQVVRDIVAPGRDLGHIDG